MLSCNDKAKQASEEKNNNTEEASSEQNATMGGLSTQPGDDLNKMMEKMKSLPALSTDQLKAMLPESMNDLKRTSFSVNSGMGYGVADARYKNEDGSKEYHVTIYDCVGTAGVAWYSMMYWGMNMEQEDENGYKKSTTFNGSKAIESFEKNNNEYSLLFPASNRLLVNVEGENTNLDGVKQVANSLNLKVN